MAKEVLFLICKHCGNLVELVNNAGVPVVCCGENMVALSPNTTEAAQEKHIPAVKVVGNTVDVQVGSTIHPMTEEHSIQWIYLETEKGCQRKNLLPNNEPKASFVVPADDHPIAVYAYCNLHGLWKASL